MKRLFCLLLLVLLLCGCSQQEPVTADFWAMDTYMNGKLWGKDAAVGMEQIRSLITQLEREWSPTDPGSDLMGMNQGAVPTPAQQELLSKAQTLSQRTGGAFDPQLHRLICLWGFVSGDYSVPDADAIQMAMAEKQWNLGAVMKGHAGQEALKLLQQLDIDYGILNLGGNVQTYGEKPDGSPWKIAIQDPKSSAQVGTVSVTGTVSVVTSGDYQRYFEQDGVRYHHILDPKTGCPADSGLSSVTVICRDGMTADALSTALFVMGLEQGIAHWRQSADFEAVWVLSSGAVYATEGTELSGCEYEVVCREE